MSKKKIPATDNASKQGLAQTSTDGPKKTLGERLIELERLKTLLGENEYKSFRPWKPKIEELESLAKQGDVEALSTLYSVATNATKALNRIAADDAPPVRVLAMWATNWPLLANASPHLNSTPPIHFGKATGFPFDWKRAFKYETVPRGLMLDLLTIIYHIRRLRTAATWIARIVTAKSEIITKETFDIKEGDRIATYEMEKRHSFFDWSDIEANELDGLKLHFERVMSTLDMPRLSKADEISENFQNKCWSLPNEVNFEWRDVAKSFLAFLTDSHPEKNPVLWKLGEHRVGLRGSRDGTTSKSDGDVRTRIYERLDEAFNAVIPAKTVAREKKRRKKKKPPETP